MELLGDIFLMVVSWVSGYYFCYYSQILLKEDQPSNEADMIFDNSIRDDFK